MTVEADQLAPVATAPRGAPPGRWELPILRWVLRRHRRALLGWSIAMAVVAAIYGSFYPLMGDTAEMEALVASLPEALVAAMGYDAIGTAAGYLTSTVYGLLGPILLLVYGLGFAARVLAGEEESGELELESAAAVSRRRLLLERYLAVVVGIACLAAVTGAATWLLVVLLDMDVAGGPLAGATVGLALLGLALASVTFAVGAATGRRSPALVAGAAVGVAAFMSNALAPMLDNGAWLERLSPFWWYLGEEPLLQGLQPWGALGLLALTLVALAVAVLAYDRRDLHV